MRQTLYLIPHQIAGLNVFGVGLLLALWAVASLVVLSILVRRYGLGPQSRGALPVIILSGAVILFVLPLLEDSNRGLPIRGYGVMMLLGVVGGVMLAVRRAPAARLDPELVFSLGFWMFASGILGARMFHVIEYWEQTYRQPTWGATLVAILNVPKGGLVVYGSFVAVTLMLPLFVWRNRLPGLALCDLITPSMLLGLALGRIGCLLNGCCYGGPSNYFWAIRFPPESPLYEDQRQVGLLHGFRIALDDHDHVVVRQIVSDLPRKAGLREGDRVVAINGRRIDSVEVAQALADQGALHYGGGPVKPFDVARALLWEAGPALELDKPDGHKVAWSIGALPTRSLPVHPTQVYSSIDAALLCLFLLAYYPFRRRDGEVFALLLTIYPICRFLTEMIRVDEPAQFGTGLSIAQLVSLVVLVGAAGLWVYLLRRPAGRLWASQPPAVAGGR